MNSILSIRHYYNELVGWLKITATDEAVTKIDFVGPPDRLPEPSTHPLLNRLIMELGNYFQGKSSAFTTPIQFNEGTPFQQTVWRELLKISAGETRSYGQVAAALDKAKAARSVGNANGRNPIPIIVPCHRVINSDGSLGGYSSGIHIKKALLNHEKIFFGTIPKETEAKLIIVSDNPSEVIHNLKTLKLLGEFPLGPNKERRFQDLYFDLPGRFLSQKKWALRLRRLGAVQKIAIKGPASGLSDGSLTRPELEMEWNLDALKRIVGLMRDIGINIAANPPRENIDAERSLKFLGLEVIQKRDTCRIVRKIFDPQNSEPVAEMDIDHVSFVVGDRMFEHYEIEIESWAAPDCPVIQKSLESLKIKLGKSVMPWRIDKLTTVQLISDLVQTGKISGLCPGDLLTRPVYEMVLEKSLRRSLCAVGSY